MKLVLLLFFINSTNLLIAQINLDVEGAAIISGKVGFTIAQELQEVLPELVSENVHTHPKRYFRKNRIPRSQLYRAYPCVNQSDARTAKTHPNITTTTRNFTLRFRANQADIKKIRLE